MSEQVKTLAIEKIARVCHQTIKAFCETIGDNSQLDWEYAPDWQKESAIKGVVFHLEELENGNQARPEASHESWMKEKVDTGWVYGPVKDAIKKTHPCIVPYAELSTDQTLKDHLFCGIVTAFFNAS